MMLHRKCKTNSFQTELNLILNLNKLWSGLSVLYLMSLEYMNDEFRNYEGLDTRKGG